MKTKIFINNFKLVKKYFVHRILIKFLLSHPNLNFLLILIIYELFIFSTFFFFFPPILLFAIGKYPLQSISFFSSSLSTSFLTTILFNKNDGCTFFSNTFSTQSLTSLTILQLRPITHTDFLSTNTSVRVKSMRALSVSGLTKRFKRFSLSVILMMSKKKLSSKILKADSQGTQRDMRRSMSRALMRM